MSAKTIVPFRRASKLARSLPWLLLWVAAPMPLWLALLIRFLMAG
jgi:hypothetical protein